MVPNKRYPAFIKPYFPLNSRKSLKLPFPFTSFVKAILPVKVLLKDHYDEKVWAVEVAKIGGDIFFRAGWTKFLEDNFLEFGDFLVFQYNGGDEFGFKILRATADRIDITRAMDFSSNEGLQEDEEEGEPVQEETGNNKKNTSEEEEELVEELEDETLIKNLGKKKARISGARTAKLGESSTGFAAMANVAVEGLNNEAHGKATAVQSDDQAFKSKVDGLQNPYFLVKYKKYRTNEVYVPQDFVNTFGAELLPEMIIRDPTGREWSTKFYIRKDKTMWMQGGWGLLALHNNVKEKDCLACELVPSRDRQGSYIQLHIHRMTQGLQSNDRPSGH